MKKPDIIKLTNSFKDDMSFSEFKENIIKIHEIRHHMYNSTYDVSEYEEGLIVGLLDSLNMNEKYVKFLGKIHKNDNTVLINGEKIKDFAWFLLTLNY